MSYDELKETLRLHARSAVCTLEPKDCAALLKVLERRDRVLRALVYKRKTLARPEELVKLAGGLE